MEKRRISIVNGFEVFTDAILILTDNGKAVLCADHENFDKLLKQYLKEKGLNVKEIYYKLMINNERAKNMEVSLLFINELNPFDN